MKWPLLVISAVVIGVICVDNNFDDQKFRRKVVWECIRESQLPWQAVLKFKNGDFDGHDVNSKDFIKCLAVRAGMIDESTDEIIEEMIFHNLVKVVRNPLMITDIIDACNGYLDSSDNIGDFAFNTYACYSNYTTNRPDIIKTFNYSVFDAVLAEARNLKLSWIRRFELNENIHEWYEQIQDIEEENPEESKE